MPSDAELYTVQHLTLREIAAQQGVTHSAIWQRLQRLGITAQQGEHVETTCAHCHTPMTVLRKRWRLHERIYCCREHYYADRLTPGAVTSRAGTQRARKIVATFFALQPEHVVHHVNHDETDATLCNLEVYASHSGHMSRHHRRLVAPIWRGVDVQGPVSEIQRRSTPSRARRPFQWLARPPRLWKSR